MGQPMDHAGGEVVTGYPAEDLAEVVSVVPEVVSADFQAVEVVSAEAGHPVDGNGDENSFIRVFKMKNAAERFLSDQDREKIKKEVEEAEKYTSGEIVPMVVSRSYHYPMSDVIGGFIFALPLSLILTYFAGGWLWIGNYNMWLFLGIITVLFVIFQQVVKRTESLKSLFISNREIEEEVEEAAITGFFREGLYRTRDETGILLFISVFERRVWVLADRGINEKVKEGQWDDIVKNIIEGIKNRDQADAIRRAVEEVGRILKEHFPVKQDDRDELKNLIIEGE